MTIFEQADAALLSDFRRIPLDIEGNRIMALVAGDGPPLLMLHGDPQTHLCWHKIAPRLAASHTVVLTDLRGRGESHQPGVGENGEAYTKRTMAAEQYAAMQALGFDRFKLVAHDRGARVARRMALDIPEAVERLAILDIVPALDFYAGLTAQIAQDYFYFILLTQDEPVPERLIAGDRRGFQRRIMTDLAPSAALHPLAMEAYLAGNATPDGIAAMCHCFRTGYHIDQLHDAADLRRGRTIACPTLVMWGTKGVIGRHFDVPAVWRKWCDEAEFRGIASGHFIPEEAPEALLRALDDWLPHAARSGAA